MIAPSTSSLRNVVIALTVALFSVAAGVGPVSNHGQAAADSDPIESSSPVDLRSAVLRQDAWRINLTLNTQGASWAPADLGTWAPGQPLRSHLCLLLDQRSRQPTLCVVRGGDGGPSVVRAVGGGRWQLARSARVTRDPQDTLTVSVAWSELGLRAGRLGWRLDSAWTDPPCDQDPGECRDLLPDGGSAVVRLRQPMPVGCSVPGPSVRYHGPRGRPFVGITFDDGPGAYTTRVLRILRRFKMSATFFQIGSQVRGANEIERKILRSGSEIGDHSYGHETYPSYGSIASGSRAILRASGFRPCVFRPPGGRTSSAVVAAARANGMRTIVWDVDPRDWSNPGTGAIIANVLAHARRGSIIIMHDGGSRGQTLAALPTILRGLRNRGLRPVKVSRLLKGSTRWG